MNGDPKPLELIERKSLLYKSGLGFTCINHVQGCSHGCRYPCHGYLIAKRHERVRDYADWCRPRLVQNALELLDRELRRKRVRPARVHLSLSTDPFMFGYPQIGEVSLALIQRLNEAGIPCSVLTKGLLPDTLADTRRFHPANIYGISLVSLIEDFRRRFEPGAAPYALRVAALRALHVRGARTRVHMEPYPTPNLQPQDLFALLCEVTFTNSIFFGGLNYNPSVDAYPNAKGFYNACRQQVRKFCMERQIECEN